MPIKNDADRWGWISLGIHWLTVVMVLGLVVVGFLMQEMPNSPAKFNLYSMHKMFGLTVLGLTVLRLLWRLFAGTPAPVAGTPRWQAAAASLAHGALYLILLAMPVSGWLYHSASGYPPRNLSWFGLFKLPSLSDRDEGLRDAALAAHEWLFIALAVIVTVHALAALKHHYVDRDRTLARMLPLAKPAPKPQDPPGA
ncbi:MAG TPA: cytochrome b [Arenimonas sp.]|uniref:cytochrome b n=1 Tax=Arenimonas sp. TaxID=1872635 RepID=UPI002D80B8A7|nr:cytochrome b [Arenimonas sp.]HEU0152091.1 cytochrome b [Arenimonas sp.]